MEHNVVAEIVDVLNGSVLLSSEYVSLIVQ